MDILSRPQLYTVSISFERSNDYGISQMSAENGEAASIASDSDFPSHAEPKFIIGGKEYSRSARYSYDSLIDEGKKSLFYQASVSPTEN